MKIIKPSFEILNISHDEPLKFIEKTARVCYKSENLITDTSAEKLVSNLIARGHEAMIEHVSVTVKFICDRGVSHELVRHRVASYAQESTRYCNYSNNKFDNELTFIKPCFWNIHSPKYHSWEWLMRTIERKYLDFINHGVTPEEARAILPNSLKTEIVMTCNLRELRHFLKLRTAKEAHPQMRELTIPLLEELKQRIPVIFDDINV